MKNSLVSFFFMVSVTSSTCAMWVSAKKKPAIKINREGLITDYGMLVQKAPMMCTMPEDLLRQIPIIKKIIDLAAIPDKGRGLAHTYHDLLTTGSDANPLLLHTLIQPNCLLYLAWAQQKFGNCQPYTFEPKDILLELDYKGPLGQDLGAITIYGLFFGLLGTIKKVDEHRLSPQHRKNFLEFLVILNKNLKEAQKMIHKSVQDSSYNDELQQLHALCEAGKVPLEDLKKFIMDHH